MTNLFEGEQELYTRTSPEVAKSIKRMENKYRLKFISIYLLFFIGMVCAFFMPYLIFLSWWAEFVGVFCWIGGAMIYAFLGTYDLWKEYKKKMNDEERQIRFSQTKSAKIEKFLQTAQSKKVLTDIALQIEQEFLSFDEDSEEKLLDLPLTTIITEINVDNDERLAILEKELDEIQKLNPSKLISNLKYIYDTVSATKNDGIPLSPIKPILKKYNFDEKTVEDILNQANELQSIYNTAKAELEKDLGIIGAGATGENRLNKELEMYEDVWKALPNIRIEVDNQSAESDNIIICKKGIFTIEAKNYSAKGNYSVHITKDGQWLRIYDNGRTEPIKNVTSQMNYHIALKQKLIHAKWKEKYGVHSKPFFLQPIFVIANDTVRIQNDTDLPIMRIPNIYHHIMKLPDIYTEEEVNKLTAIILENALPPKKFSLNSYLPGFRKAYDALAQNERRLSENSSAYIFHYVAEARDVIEHKYI